MSNLWGPEHVNELPEVPKLRTPIEELTELSGLEFGLIRESLGLSAKQLAEWLGVAKFTVLRWEALDVVPPVPTAGITKITAASDMWAHRLAVGAEARVYQGGWRIVDGRPLPESWWRGLVGGALRRNPMLAVHEVEDA